MPLHTVQYIIAWNVTSVVCETPGGKKLFSKCINYQNVMRTLLKMLHHNITNKPFEVLMKMNKVNTTKEE